VESEPFEEGRNEGRRQRGRRASRTGPHDPLRAVGVPALNHGRNDGARRRTGGGRRTAPFVAEQCGSVPEGEDLARASPRTPATESADGWEIPRRQRQSAIPLSFSS
jgi:hypothetical protein